MAEEERLDILSSFATGIAVTHVADSHLTRKEVHLGFIEDFCHKAVALYSVKISIRAYSNYTATLLTSVLKSMQAIISQACCIFNSIYSKDATFVVELVISVFVTITHFIRVFYCQLFSAEICYRIIKERLLQSLIHYILEKVTLITLGMSHLTENLAVAADDTLDSIV